METCKRKKGGGMNTEARMTQSSIKKIRLEDRWVLAVLENIVIYTG